jgi:GNAT superfamily N-acetyltransferase
VLTTADLAGASLWAEPQRPFGGLISRLVLPFHMRRLLGPRTEMVRTEIARLNASRPREPHWYLPTIGVDPERQSRGIGEALMRPVLERCDAEGTPAYLESTRPRNLIFYGRLGFEIVDELEVGGGPVVWAMLRQPKGATAARSR